MCDSARRTGTRPLPPAAPMAGRSDSGRPPVRAPGRWGARSVLASRPPPPLPGGTCCASPISENSPLPLPLPPHSRGCAKAGEEGARKGWGLGKIVPVFPALHPHPNSAAVTWCLEWEVGRRGETFLGARERQYFLQSQPLTPAPPRSAPEREPEERRPADRSPGAGDAGAAGGTCGSSGRGLRWPGRP